MLRLPASSSSRSRPGVSAGTVMTLVSSESMSRTPITHEPSSRLTMLSTNMLAVS